LCRKTLRLPLNQDEPFALVPEITAVDRAKSFKTGGLLSWRDSIDWLLATCERCGERTLPQVWLLQDVWGARPTDPAAPRKLVNKFFDTTNVYYFSDLDEQNVETIERQVASFLLVGFLVTFSLREGDLPKITKAGKTLMDKGCSIRRRDILVTAYDREGLVLWATVTASNSARCAARSDRRSVRGKSCRRCGCAACHWAKGTFRFRSNPSIAAPIGGDAGAFDGDAVFA